MEIKEKLEEKSRILGLDYVIETTGEEFVDKNLYFVCLLCAKTEAHSALQSHLMSVTHRMQFLIRHFPSTADVFEDFKEVLESDKLRSILDCVFLEIAKHYEDRKSHNWKETEYDSDSAAIDEEILSKIKPYDNTLNFVVEMNDALRRELGSRKSAQNSEISAATGKEHEDSSAVVLDSKSPLPFVEPTNVYNLDENSSTKDISNELKAIESSSEIVTISGNDNKQTDSNSSPQVEVESETTAATDAKELLNTEDDPEILELKINESELKADGFISLSPIKQNYVDDGSNISVRALSLSPISSEEANDMDVVEGPILPTESPNDLRNQVLTSVFTTKLKKYAHDLDSLYDNYVKEPHTHPMYDANWKHFYLEHQQTITQNDDDNVLNMWSKYWSQRLQILKTQNFCQMKEKLRLEIFGSSKHDSDDSNDCEILEPVREVIDVSDDEEHHRIKRQKIEETQQKPDSCLTSEYLMKKPEYVAEIERMKVAIRIAQQLIHQGKKPNPEELIQLVKAEIEQRDGQQEVESIEDLSNEDLVLLFHNFNQLSAGEQTKFIERMKSIQQNFPERYQSLFNDIDKMEQI